jgi:hypothetical protein
MLKFLNIEKKIIQMTLEYETLNQNPKMQYTKKRKKKKKQKKQVMLG